MPDPPGVPREILVLKPSSLGDVVHTLPSVRRLKQGYPSAKIRWVVNPEWSPLLRGNPDLQEVIEFPRAQFHGLGWTLPFWRWARGLRQFRPDLALDFQGLFRTGVMARASGASRTLCLANAEFLNRALASRVVPMRRDEHAVDRYLGMIAALDIRGDETVRCPLPEGDPVKEVSLPDRFVLLHPFARGEGKSLSADQASLLVRELGNRPVVLVGRSDIAIPALPRNAVNLLNRTTLTQLIWLVRRSDFVVSADSGPMHIAAAITPRLLSIHTWSDPRLVGPYDPDAWLWKAGEILRKRDLTPGLATQSRGVGEEDVRSIANCVRRFL